MRYRIHIQNGKLISCHLPDRVVPGGDVEYSVVPPMADTQIHWEDVPQLIKERMAVLDLLDDGYMITGVGSVHRTRNNYGTVYFIHDTEVADATVAV